MAEVMYVKIQGSHQARKDILKSALESTRLLRDFEKYKTIKSKKTKKIKELHKVFKEIKTLKSQLKRHGLPTLPSHIRADLEFQEAQAKKPRAPIKVVSPKQALKVKTKKKISKKKVKRHKTVSDHLSSEIDDIESMINKL